jgi:hypothetical protein
MSASFYAAGPDIRPSSRGIGTIRTIDIAPTVARILGVTPSSTVQGEALDLGRAPLQLLSAVSRKKHGAAGEFDPINVALGILLGDVTADRIVNAGDLNEVRAGAAQNTAPDASSFRADLRTNGRTGRADVVLCEENVGH